MVKRVRGAVTVVAMTQLCGYAVCGGLWGWTGSIVGGIESKQI